jgi:hypothetical protein
MSLMYTMAIESFVLGLRGAANQVGSALTIRLRRAMQ